jgi:hypothetical protein
MFKIIRYQGIADGWRVVASRRTRQEAERFASLLLRINPDATLRYEIQPITLFPITR